MEWYERDTDGGIANEGMAAWLDTLGWHSIINGGPVITASAVTDDGRVLITVYPDEGYHKVYDAQTDLELVIPNLNIHPADRAAQMVRRFHPSRYSDQHA